MRTSQSHTLVRWMEISTKLDNIEPKRTPLEPKLALAPLQESVEQRHCSMLPLRKQRRSWFLWSKYASTSSHCFVEQPRVVT